MNWLFEAMWSFQLSGWLNVIGLFCSYYPGRLLLVVIYTGATIPNVYEQNTWNFYPGHIVARFFYSLKVATPVQQSIKLTVILEIAIHELMEQTGYSFQILVLNIYC